MTTMKSFPADAANGSVHRRSLAAVKGTASAAAAVDAVAASIATATTAVVRSAALALVVVSLLAVATALPGCSAAGFAAVATGASRVKPIFKLEDRTTLVLVDDPANLLGDPSLVNVVAARASFALVENKAVKQIIKPATVNDLRATLGADFENTPVALIGREVGADQVIHVVIEDAVLAGEPGLLRPTAMFEVKVIDAVGNKRIFPAPLADDMPGVSSLGQGAGFKKGVTMAYRPSGREGQNLLPELRRKLAERIGLETAQVFYEHDPATMLIPGD